ncbi:MAG: fatty acid desaturase [Pseudomonadota bacterium]
MARRAGFLGPEAASGRAKRFEGPTWAALILMHLGWLLVLGSYETLGWIVCIPAAILTAFHSSLQHEALHGHPTRNAMVNEVLVSLPFGLLIPYRSFRDSHLRHHNDNRLTDPYDDPETWYIAEREWPRLSPPLRWLLWVNGTLAGRLLIGPALMSFGFLRAEFRAIRAGDRLVQGAWLRHLAGLGVVLLLVRWSGMPLWLYVIGVVWPALSLLSVRTFIEHRAASCPKQRSAVVESGWFWSLLFLNNNLHRLHHERPAVAWYDLPGLWQHERARVLEENGGYHFESYGAVAKRWLFSRREPMVHPLVRREGR